MIIMLMEYNTEENREVFTELKNVILLILTIIDLVFIFFSITYSVNFKLENIFADYDFLVCLLLFLDLSYDYYKYEGTLKDFLIKDKNIFALISILPYDLIFRYFSVFRLFRLVKIIKLIRIYNVKRDFGSLVYFIQNHLFKLLFVILIIYVAVSSVLLIIVDGAVNSIPDALWFMVVTASTVGYGDIVPTSPEGKALSALTILIGIIFASIFTAYLSAVYNEKPEMETRETIFKYVKKLEKTNKLFKSEFITLNDKVNKLEEENRELKEELSKINNKLDEISNKLE